KPTRLRFCASPYATSCSSKGAFGGASGAAALCDCSAGFVCAVAAALAGFATGGGGAELLQAEASSTAAARTTSRSANRVPFNIAELKHTPRFVGKERRLACVELEGARGACPGGLPGSVDRHPVDHRHQHARVEPRTLERRPAALVANL